MKEADDLYLLRLLA